MICPICASDTKIYNSRGTHGKTQTWRRHRCQRCSSTFTTKERIIWDGKVDIETEETTTPYSKERLFLSLLRAGASLQLAPGTLSELCDTVESHLQTSGFFNNPVQKAATITDTITDVLHRFSPNLALQYINNVYRHQPPAELVKQLLEPPETS